MSSFELRLLDLAGRQHYVVTHDQLREFGSRRQISQRVASGLLESVSRSVYRIKGSPKTWHQQLLAACYATSGVSAVSFRAAARLWSLPGGEEIIEITSPRHDRTQRSEVRTHESFFLTDLDVTWVNAVPVTRPARVICDLALLVKRGELSGDTLELAMHEAFRRDLLDVARVWKEWDRLGRTRRPGGFVVERLLTRFVEPLRKPDTAPETRLLQLLRAAGLPEPVPQHRVWLSKTRWYQLDFAWPHERVFCEFDSYKWHGSRSRYMRTTRRRLELERNDWSGVPVTDDELDAGAPLAIALLQERLNRAS
jgi:predicted transcriptional regulator of viral defense system